MGSQGMKRKGRKHLPKVGTRPANEAAVHERREQAMHPFSADPYDKRRTTGPMVVAIAVVFLIAIGVFALILAT